MRQDVHELRGDRFHVGGGRVLQVARDRGETYPEADALRTAQFFMLGLYAMLITSHGRSRAERAEILDNFVATVLRSVEAR
jgi:TetR/AcrR family transcriptional repressor of uid operon